MKDYNAEILSSGFVTDKRAELSRHATKKWDSRDPEKLEGMVVHQSLEDYGTAFGNAKYHVGPNHISQDGLPGLCYTFFIEKDGTIILANNVEDVTYSQGYTANSRFIGTCVGGNFSGPGYSGTQVPTLAQQKAVLLLWVFLRAVWGWSSKGIHGHFHFGKKACPGYVLESLVLTERGENFLSVHARQQALKTLGFYNGVVDGQWGPISKGALYKFQLHMGIEQSGAWTDEVSSIMEQALRA